MINVENFVANIKKGVKGGQFMFATNPLKNIRKRGDLGFLHQHNLIKVTYISNTNIGSSYKGNIDSIAENEYEVKPFSWQEWKMYPYLVTDAKTRTKDYFVVTYRASSKAKVVTKYYLDGREVSEELSKLIYAEEHHNDKPMSSTQLEAGLTEEDRVIFLNYSVDNILALRLGGHEFYNACPNIGCDTEDMVKELLLSFTSK